MHQVFATFLLVIRELYIINAMEENDFIKENIVGRKESWKKKARHYTRVVFSALLFGALSAGTFAVTEPLIASKLHNDETEAVTFETEPETEETETETVPETTVAPTEPETEPPEETVPIESVVRDEVRKYEYNMDDYERMHSVLKKLAISADYSLVEVRSRVTGNDLFGELVQSGSSSAGIIIARTSSEVLILTSDSVMQDTSTIEVSFYGDKVYSAQIKAVDSADGIAIVSVPLSGITYRDSQEIRSVSIGDSSMLQRGDMIVIVGAPAGTYGSSTVGEISSVSYNTVDVDGNVKDMIADVDIDPTYGSFVINTDGELVGWIKTDEVSKHGYERVIGISDYIDIIETMSNGTEYPYLGLKAQEETQEMLDARLPKGLYIRESIQNSPAYNAGIQNGDILVRINDTDITNMKDYQDAISALTVDDTAVVTIMRQNGAEYAEVEFTVTVAGR